MLLDDFANREQGMMGGKADLPENVGPSNAGEPQRFDPAVMEDQIARAEPLLAGQDFDFAGIEFVEFDPFLIARSISLANDDPPVGQRIAFAEVRHPQPEIEHQAKRDIGQRPKIPQREDADAGPIGAEPADEPSQWMRPDRGPNRHRGHFAKFRRGYAGKGRSHGGKDEVESRPAPTEGWSGSVYFFLQLF